MNPASPTVPAAALDAFTPAPLQALPAQPRAVTGPARVLESAQLLGGGKSVAIEHNGAIYRLQATKLGKLILTK